MKRVVPCLVSLLLLGALAAGAGKALSKDEVVQLLTTGAEPRVIALVHQCGIDFGVDDVVERDVRAAGGGDNLIAALREEADKEAKKHLALGDTFLQAGDLDGAATQYAQALRFDSKNAGAHIGMGKVREQRGDTEAALAEYQEAIKARPDSGAAYNALGAFWVKKGEQKKALEAYRSGLEAEPENAELKANYIRAAGGPAGDVPLVNLDVMVMTNGFFVPGLKQENFRVLEDGVPQNVTAFNQSEAPRNQYSLAYHPSNAKQDGTYRKIKVELVNKNGGPLQVNVNGKPAKVSIIAPDGYTAKHQVK